MTLTWSLQTNFLKEKMDKLAADIAQALGTEDPADISAIETVTHAPFLSGFRVISEPLAKIGHCLPGLRNNW